MKAVERLLEKRQWDILNFDRIEFGIMPGKERDCGCYMHRKDVARGYIEKKENLYVCFVDLEKDLIVSLGKSLSGH